VIKGTTKFDGIAIGEFQAKFVGPTLEFVAKAAFVNSKTGDTHGWTTNRTWSPQVITKLKELKGLMELDLGAVHFDGGGELMDAAVHAPYVGDRQEPGGLGELLSVDAPSV
jgi:hypothetical protein